VLWSRTVTKVFDAAGAVERLLSEDAEVTRHRERTEFDQVVAEHSGMVLFGAGNLGRQAIKCLRQDGVEPGAITDNNPAKWGSDMDGVAILSPQDTAARFGSSHVFVVTIWNDRQRFAETAKLLTALGCRTVIASPPLRWKYETRIPAFPFFFLDLPSKIHASSTDAIRGAKLWADDASRREYVAQMRLRFLGDLLALPAPLPNQYSYENLFLPDEREVFVDCGAFDGDTVRDFVSAWNGRFESIYALEPDPTSFRHLTASIDMLPSSVGSRVRPLQVAVADRSGTVSFHADGTMGAAIAPDGNIQVPCRTLDDMFHNQRVTYVKMDIEGYELAALNGSLSLVSRNRPVFAVCAYHTPDHLWSIPLYMQERLNDYSLFLRPHKPDGWDLIVYAVPNERLAHT
jgi:FkbM family methyltransferase